VVAAAGLLAACAGRPRTGRVDPTAPRLVPIASAIVLGTAGPVPADTTVTFPAGEPRVIVLRHGPPENVVFAELSFPPRAFRADSGRPVTVEVRPRRGEYGLDLRADHPFAQGGTVTFKYARYFLAPARAHEAFGSDVLYERALVVGQVLPGATQLRLLPSTRPVADDLRAPVDAPATYLVAAAP
jgi:hypothetical protein